MMKKIIIACILCITIICACTADKNRNISNRSTGSSIESNSTGSIAASGSMPSVTETVVKSDKSKKIQTNNISTLRYANDKNIYLGDGDQKIYQYDLCGRRQKYYDMCQELGKKYHWLEVLWVDNDDVFFSCNVDFYSFEIWRVPLNRKKNGLEMKKKEKIVEKIEELDCLVTKNNEEIIYYADGELSKVSLKTKQKQVLKTGTDYHIPVYEIMKDRHGIPFIQDNKIYYEGDRDRMYQMDLDDWNPIYIEEKGGLGFRDFIETEGDNLYFEAQDEDPNRFHLLNVEIKGGLERYNLQSGEKVKLFSWEKLQEEVENLGTVWKLFTHKVDWKKGWGEIGPAYYHENRMYVAVEVSQEDDWEAWLMFSCQASDGSDFRFEQEVTEYLWKNSIPYKTYIETEEGAYNLENVTGEFLYYLDGCIVMHFYDKKAKGDDNTHHREDIHHRFVVYDINTGTFRKIKKYSKEYGYLKALGFSETSEVLW